MISLFRGKYSFLSNFHSCKIEYQGITYGSVEAAFQAAKSLIHKERIKFSNMGPVEAKRAGRKVTLRPDWDQAKTLVMLDILRIKFSNKYLANLLLATGDEELVEGNTWGDTFWGVCNGVGNNRLGKLLMQIRGELK